MTGACMSKQWASHSARHRGKCAGLMIMLPKSPFGSLLRTCAIGHALNRLMSVHAWVRMEGRRG